MSMTKTIGTFKPNDPYSSGYYLCDTGGRRLFYASTYPEQADQ